MENTVATESYGFALMHGQIVADYIEQRLDAIPVSKKTNHFLSGRKFKLNFLSDVITYIRRLIKSPSDSTITDNLIIDYINRFWIMDVDARIQLFDLKSSYVFQTIPGVDQYNMPLYSVQSEGSNPSTSITLYPAYQGFKR
jgi:hypothetical protein